MPRSSAGVGSNQYEAKGSAAAPQPRSSTSKVAAVLTPASPDLPAPLTETSLNPMTRPLSHYLPSTYSDRTAATAEIFDLSAPYQRGSVWEDDQRRALIKSLLLKLPTGAILISKVPYDKFGATYRIVDGKQRIETVRTFVAGNLTIPGWWVHPRWLNDPADRERDITFDDLSPQGQTAFTTRSIPSIEFDPQRESHRDLESGKWQHRDRTPEEILRAEAEMYLLINFGGVEQTEEDWQRAADMARQDYLSER